MPATSSHEALSNPCHIYFVSAACRQTQHANAAGVDVVGCSARWWRTIKRPRRSGLTHHHHSAQRDKPAGAKLTWCIVRLCGQPRTCYVLKQHHLLTSNDAGKAIG